MCYVYIQDTTHVSLGFTRLQLEELSEPGTYIVELIGGGQSSRCLVRKGRLRHVEKTDAAGHAFLVLDEAGEGGYEKGCAIRQVRVAMGGE